MKRGLAFLKYLAVCIAVITLFACEHSSPENQFSGYIEAEYVYVSALESGWITTNAVREGDMVEEGQALLTLDKTHQFIELKAAKEQVEKAQAQYQDLVTGARPDEINRLNAQRKEAIAARALAGVERRRLAALRAKGAAAQSSVDQAIAEFNAADARVDSIDAEIRLAKSASRENTIAAAKAALNVAKTTVDSAQWRLDQRTVYARRAGRVEQVYFRQGEQIAAGAPILALLPDDALKVRFFVPQSKLANFPIGMTVSVKQDGVTEPVTAQVAYIANGPEYTPPVIYSVASRQKLVFLIEAALKPGSGLRPGQPVDVLLTGMSND